MRVGQFLWMEGLVLRLCSYFWCRIYCIVLTPVVWMT